MADTAKINDLVDGVFDDFGKFRGVVTNITQGTMKIYGTGEEYEVAIAHVAVLGFCNTIAVLRDNLHVLRSDAIPLQPGDGQRSHVGSLVKHRASLPNPIARDVCVKCRAQLVVAALRQLGTSDGGNPIYQCRNQAACRKRERQLQAKASTQEKR